MDYKEKYEKAVHAAMLAKQDTESAVTIGILEEIFPELKESEDERIRKEIIAHIKWCEDSGYCAKEEMTRWITFLEKQGEQKPVYTKEYDFHGIKFIPKFAKGDTIKDKKCGEVSTIKDFSYDTGLYTHTYGQFPITIQDNYELVEQKPVAWSKEDENLFRCAIDAVREESKVRTDGCLDEEVGGMVIDWLSSLKGKVGCEAKCTTTKEWSEEDEKILNLIIARLHSHQNVDAEEYGKDYHWLKSLKERVQPKQEWDEEDEKKRNLLIAILNVHHPNGCFKVNPIDTTDMEAMSKDELVSWLKSLGPQKQWKPSDEQIGALEAVINNRSFQRRLFVSLIEQLKKLRKE